MTATALCYGCRCELSAHALADLELVLLERPRRVLLCLECLAGHARRWHSPAAGAVWVLALEAIAAEDPGDHATAKELHLHRLAVDRRANPGARAALAALGRLLSDCD